MPDVSTMQARNKKPVGCYDCAIDHRPPSRDAADILYVPVTKFPKVGTTVGITADGHIDAMTQCLVRRSEAHRRLLPPGERDDESEITRWRASA
jgi:hypothetical protein